MRAHRKTAAWLTAVVIVAGLIAGGIYGLKRVRRVQAAGSVPTAPVRAGDFAELVRCRGEISSKRSVPLTAPMNVPDLKIVWLAEPGSRVKAGDVVIRFDASGAKRQLEEQKAALRQAKASLDQAVAQARITGEQDKLALANAHYEVERARLEASKQAIVSALQGEASRIDLATAESKLRVQEATVALHKKSDEARIASLGRQLEKAQADVDLTTRRIEQTSLKAPVDGMLSIDPNYSQGWMNAQPFKVGDQVWPGAVVGEIPDSATLQMECKVEEVDRGRIAAGNETRIHMDALPERTFHSTLESISALTQMTFEWPPSRNFKAYALVSAQDAALRPGMNGSMDVVVRHVPNAITVPAKAVFTKDGKPVVYVLGPSGYRMVRVEVLARNPDEVAVSGLERGASVALAEPESGQEARKP